MTRSEAHQFCLSWSSKDRRAGDVAMIDDLLRLSEQTERRAVMLEREACAQVAETLEDPLGDGYHHAQDIAQTIRSRP